MKSSDDTLVRLINHLNSLYIKQDHIEIKSIINFLTELNNNKSVVYVLSDKHDSEQFIGVFTCVKELADYLQANDKTISNYIRSGKVKGSYTKYGYISKIKIKDFIERWFKN